LHREEDMDVRAPLLCGLYDFIRDRSDERHVKHLRVEIDRFSGIFATIGNVIEARRRKHSDLL
jgi:hypothetical protein